MSEASNHWYVLLQKAEAENAKLREALEKIVSFKPNESQWHTSRGGRFWACQEIARNALKEIT